MFSFVHFEVGAPAFLHLGLNLHGFLAPKLTQGLKAGFVFFF